MEDWLTAYKIPIGKWIASFVKFLNEHAAFAFNAVSDGLGFLIDGLIDLMHATPPLLLVAIFAAFAYWLHRSVGLVALVVGSLLFIMNQGYWAETVETLALVIFATGLCMLIGVPIGIAAAHRPWLYTAIRPILDLMQTIPTFVYLIPALILFGLGVVPGLISTIIFAIPAPIRLTYLGVAVGAQAADRGGRGVRRDAPPAAVEGRAAARHADHHGRAHPVHHAVLVHGRDRRPGRRRRPRQAGRARAQLGQHRPGLRGRPRDRAGRDPARSRVQAARAPRRELKLA